MLHIHPTIKAALALESLMKAQTVQIEITPTADIYTQAGLPVLKYVVVPKSVQVSGDSIQIVPACTRALVDAKSVLPSLEQEEVEDSAETTSEALCVKCGETLSEDEIANYGHLCGFCNSTSQERGIDE
jgi:hypothetical protein